MSRRVGFSQRGQADISIGRKMRTFLLAHHNLRSLPCLDYVPPLKYSGTLGEWCNGSTADSGSACLGSNPSSPVLTLSSALRSFTATIPLDPAKPCDSNRRVAPPWISRLRRFASSSGDNLPDIWRRRYAAYNGRSEHEQGRTTLYEMESGGRRERRDVPDVRLCCARGAGTAA